MSENLDPGSESEEPSSTSSLQTKSTPLPKLQLFLVILIQFAEPVTSSVIYPFIAKLVWDTGVTGDEKEIGYFAGIVVSQADFCSAWPHFSPTVWSGIHFLSSRILDRTPMGPCCRPGWTEACPVDGHAWPNDCHC